MSRSDLLVLAEWCETATGPDRELDAAIQRALGSGSTEHWFADFLGNWVTDDHAPTYTASLDAAMTLAGSDAGFWLAKGRKWAAGYGDEFALGDGGEAATPALALCAAALRARAASTPSLNAEIAGMNQGDSL